MSNRPNSKQKRRRSGFPSPKKPMSIGVGIARPGKAKTKRVATAGETFLNTTIDLVADPSNSHSLKLLLWDGSRAKVAPRIEIGRAVHEPIALDPTIVHCIQWPNCPLKHG